MGSTSIVCLLERRPSLVETHVAAVLLVPAAGKHEEFIQTTNGTVVPVPAGYIFEKFQKVRLEQSKQLGTRQFVVVQISVPSWFGISVIKIKKWNHLDSYPVGIKVVEPSEVSSYFGYRMVGSLARGLKQAS